MGVSDPDRLEQIAWALPKELRNYDFLAANGHIVARLATRNIEPSQILQRVGTTMDAAKYSAGKLSG